MALCGNVYYTLLLPLTYYFKLHSNLHSSHSAFLSNKIPLKIIQRRSQYEQRLYSQHPNYQKNASSTEAHLTFPRYSIFIYEHVVLELTFLN